MCNRAGGHGRVRADSTKEAQVAVAALQASAQGEGCPGMITTYAVKHIQKANNEILGVDEKRQNVIQFTQNKERYSSLYGMVVSGNNIHFLFSSCVI